MAESKADQPKLFLSYSSADRAVAHRIASTLESGGIRVWVDSFELNIGDSLIEKLQSVVASTDYLLVLLSPSAVQSKWVRMELSAARDLQMKGVTLLPAIVQDCVIPPPFAQLQSIDLRVNFDLGLEKLIQQIKAIPTIDWSALDPFSFERLICDLLGEQGFEVVLQHFDRAGQRVDFQAERQTTNPDGSVGRETWLVETKFYKKERADLETLHQLDSYLTKLPTSFKAVLVTNGQLTSAAREWLGNSKSGKSGHLRVIEGLELKRLLLANHTILQRYFPTEESQ
jgi:hypothetical protein